MLADIRDELAEDIRIVLEPRSRTVDAFVLMEQLFKLTDLELRISLNMNVLSRGQVPVVMGLSDVLTEWLGHRKTVLRRRSEHRLRQIEHRLEVLGGYLIAYLNIDEVIRIIREEDEPKQELIRRFTLTDVQAEAILNMRLRSLRKLEEFEIRTEHDKLTTEKREIVDLLGSDEKQWQRISEQIAETKKRFGKSTDIGRRRTRFDDLPEIDVDVEQAMVEQRAGDGCAVRKGLDPCAQRPPERPRQGAVQGRRWAVQGDSRAVDRQAGAVHLQRQIFYA